MVYRVVATLTATAMIVVAYTLRAIAPAGSIANVTAAIIILGAVIAYRDTPRAHFGCRGRNCSRCRVR